MTPLEKNARDLELELTWLAKLIDIRFKLYFGQETDIADLFQIDPPEFIESDSHYARLIAHYQLAFSERVALILSLAPHIRPQLLDIFFTKNKTFDRPFTEFGGQYNKSQLHFIPTGETYLFILSGTNLSKRFTLQAIFDGDHIFAQHNILRLAPENDEPLLKAPLELSQEIIDYLTTGQPQQPNFGVNFPARYITTDLTWDDLILHSATKRHVAELETWLQHGQTLMNDWNMAPKLRPGYRALFYGPPGTGKTMTACLLGKSTGRDVYKVDLSLVISKYIGETEKNLAKVFDQAQHKGWILFFDEADALFGKRSETKSAHDRYANQDVSFLLQRIETFDGIAILASNRRDNLDDAFTRRFEAIIYFPMPRPEERLQLWKQGFSPQADINALDLEHLAKEHTLAGGAIMNVIRYASLQALKNGGREISGDDILQGIKREYAKEGKKG